MTDLDEIINELAKAAKQFQRVVWGIIALLVALILWWTVHSDGGRPEVGGKIAEIRTTTEINERRADAIVDAAKVKESEVMRDVAEKVFAANNDDLPDLLAGLLRDYRTKH